MNPLGNNGTQLPPELQQNIQQIKGFMHAINGDPSQLAQQNPMFNQVLQMCKGQDPQQLFMAMCKQRGVDPEAILRELRS